jgi:hypothetical protein
MRLRRIPNCGPLGPLDIVEYEKSNVNFGEIQHMKMNVGALGVLLVCAPFLSTQAANVLVDCSKKASVNTALGKLDRSVANTVTINGTCTEDVVISAHRDLSIVGNAGAGLVATVLSGVTATNTVTVNGNSRVTLQSLSITGGSVGVYCDDRSTCVLKNVAIQGGQDGGLTVQKQSSADVLGSSSITNSGGIGIGVYGASSVNVGDSDEATAPPGPVISGHGYYGLFAQDGSFLRTDNATISGNGAGVGAERSAVIKILGAQSKVINNAGEGVWVRASTAQLGGLISGNNPGPGVSIAPLAFVRFAGATVTGNSGKSVLCQTPTSITSPTLAGGSNASITFNDTNCP